MSYEGYDEYLCANGHFTSCDCHEDAPRVCGFCGAPITHWHAVDCTNGIEYADYSEDGQPIGAPIDCTVPAPREEIGYDDKWLTDHHGNRYSQRIPRYKAVGAWRALASGRTPTSSDIEDGAAQP